MTNAIDKYAPQNFQQLMEFAEVLSRTGVVPDQYKGKPGEIVAVVQMGSELGMTPMMSLISISVINGKPSLWGDGLLGVVSGHESFEDILEEIMDPMTPEAAATCTVKRRGRSAVARSFSVNDARAAGLWGRRGPWSSYPMRMLQMRARGWAIRDCFPDILRGMGSTEEHRDMDAHVQQAPEVSERAKELLGEPQVAYPSVAVKEVERELLAPYVTVSEKPVDDTPEVIEYTDGTKFSIESVPVATVSGKQIREASSTQAVVENVKEQLKGDGKKKGRGRPTLSESLQKMFDFFAGHGVDAGDVFKYLGVDDIDGVRSKELKKLREVAKHLKEGVNPDDFFASQPSGDIPPPPVGNIADARQ